MGFVPLIIGAIAAATTGLVVSTAIQGAEAQKKAGKAQEEAMQQQAASQAATQKQTAEMEAKSKADAEALKLSSTQADEQARKDELKKRARVTKTLLTGPQGVLATADTGKKTLLGE